MNREGGGLIGQMERILGQSRESKLSRVRIDLIGLYRSYPELGIDFDFTNGQFPAPSHVSKEEALKQLRRLSTCLEIFPEKDREFLKCRLGCSEYYLRALTGENINFGEYIEGTLCVPKKEVVEIPENETEKMFQQYQVALLELGYEFTPEGIREFRKRFRIKTGEIQIVIQQHGEKAVRLLQNFLGIDVGPISYSIGFVQKDEYWKSWTSRDRDGFHLVINNHERHRDHWNRGVTELYSIHELAGHIFHGFSMRRAMEGGETEEAVARFTTVPGPEQVILEGVAETLSLPSVIPGLELSKEAKVALAERYLRYYLYHNAQIRVSIARDEEEKERHTKEAIAYIQSYLPLETKEEILKEIGDRIDNPRLRTYRLAYSLGILALRETFAVLTTEDSRRQLLRKTYERLLTVSQFKEEVQRIQRAQAA